MILPSELADSLNQDPRRVLPATTLQDRGAMRSRYGPILQPETFDLRELPRVMRNEDGVRHMCVTSNERVERPDRPAAPLERRRLAASRG